MPKAILDWSGWARGNSMATFLVLGLIWIVAFGSLCAWLAGERRRRVKSQDVCNSASSRLIS